MEKEDYLRFLSELAASSHPKGLSNGNFTRSQQIALAMAPKFTAFLSILCSATIIHEIAILDRTKLQKVYHRLLLVMSMCDIIKATGEFCSTWPIPQEESNGVVWNIGSQETCSWQASCNQFGIVSPLLNVSLSLYYVLMIRFGWTESRLKGWVERCLHGVPLLFALAVTIAGIQLDLYNSANIWCWIAPYPPDCLQSYKNGGETTCERGDNASIYQWAFYYVWVWSAIAFVMVAMGILYQSFRRVESANRKYAGVVAKSKSREVAIQGIWYVAGFYMTYLFPTLNRLIQLISDETVYSVLLLHALLVPSQGIWNFFVYVRPRIINHRRDNPDEGIFRSIKTIMYDNYIEYAQKSEHDADSVHREWESFRLAGRKRKQKGAAINTSVSDCNQRNIAEIMAGDAKNLEDREISDECSTESNTKPTETPNPVCRWDGDDGSA